MKITTQAGNSIYWFLLSVFIKHNKSSSLSLKNVVIFNRFKFKNFSKLSAWFYIYQIQYYKNNDIRDDCKHNSF